jgi:three-Cys-motif partner protein
MTTQTDHTDAMYWADYDGLQDRKHKLLARYLDAWFPILATRQGLIMYVESHAGRGVHETGDAGSPIVALRRLLNHSQRERILRGCTVGFHFFENNPTNAAILEAEVQKLSDRPERVKVNVYGEDYAAALTELLDELEADGTRLAPSFAFVDPYGYSLSGALLNRFLKAGTTELLLNFMSRYIDIAIKATDKDELLDRLFQTPSWRELRAIADRTERINAAINLFAAGLDARYKRWVSMRGDADEIKYILLHATNNLEGLRQFKRAIWAVIPDGSHTAYQSDRPEQGVLIGNAVEPPHSKVRELLWREFADKVVNLQRDIYPVIDDSPYLDTHAHHVLKEDFKEGRISCVDGAHKLVLKNNPTIRFAAGSECSPPKPPPVRGGNKVRA